MKKKKSEIRIHTSNVDRAYNATRLYPAGTQKPRTRVGGNYEFNGGSLSGRVNLGAGSPSFTGRLEKKIRDATVGLSGGAGSFDKEIMFDIAIPFKKGGAVKKKKAKSRVNESGNYTKPSLRKRLFSRIKSGGKGGKPGQWSARKAQMLAKAYKDAGGGYRS